MSTKIKKTADKIKIEINNDVSGLDEIKAVFGDFAKTIGFSADDIVYIKIAISEAIYNGLFHAYEEKEKEKKVLIHAKKIKNGIEIEVVDFGKKKWYPEYTPPKFETLDEILAEGGRGIIMMKYCMDEIHISHPSNQNGTIVLMRKFISKKGEI